MSKIEWPSEEEKLAAIGYLSTRGVITSIEATVPVDKVLKFKREFAGKYDPEYPYTANKFGYQFRIYLNVTEACPTFLYNQLDNQYKNRINDTDFIRELVLDYGFRFSKKWPAPEGLINSAVIEKGRDVSKGFRKGVSEGAHWYFISSLTQKLISAGEFNLPNINIGNSTSDVKKSGKIHRNNMGETEPLPKSYLLHLGWLGEAYLYHLFKKSNVELFQALGIDVNSVRDIEWFNQECEKCMRDPRLWREWQDRSVGKGCDFMIHTDTQTLYVEVKSSKRKSSFFSMSSSEIQKMEVCRDAYALIKINYLENVLTDDKPEILVYSNPFEIFFNTQKIKEATFLLGE